MHTNWQSMSLIGVQGSREWQVLDRVWLTNESAFWALRGLREKRAGSDLARSGLLVATNRRLIFVICRWRAFFYEDLPYEKITSVRVQTGWGSGVLRIVASGGDLVVRRLSNDQLIASARWLRNWTLIDVEEALPVKTQHA